MYYCSQHILKTTIGIHIHLLSWLLEEVINDCALIAIIFNSNLDQIWFTSVADIMCEEDEGNGDDEIATEVVSDEDEILRVCHTLKAM